MMGIKSKIKTFFLLDDEYDDDDVDNKMDNEAEHEQAPRHNQTSSKQNIVSLQSVNKGSKVILVEPRV